MDKYLAARINETPMFLGDLQNGTLFKTNQEVAVIKDVEHNVVTQELQVTPVCKNPAEIVKENTKMLLVAKKTISISSAYSFLAFGVVVFNSQNKPKTCGFINTYCLNGLDISTEAIANSIEDDFNLFFSVYPFMKTE